MARQHGGWADPGVVRGRLILAQSLGRVVLLTYHAEDFHDLHRQKPGHRGIIAVYRGADPRKNMIHAQIAAAIHRLGTQG